MVGEVMGDTEEEGKEIRRRTQRGESKRKYV